MNLQQILLSFVLFQEKISAFAPQAGSLFIIFTHSRSLIRSSGSSDDIFENWDPRLSPHMYPEGIPSKNSSTDEDDQSKEKEVEKIGVLLIDHGSRKAESNAFLHILAQQYQSSQKCPPHVIVGAAHMEIAPPSIEMGISSLIDAGASKSLAFIY